MVCDHENRLPVFAKDKAAANLTRFVPIMTFWPYAT